MLVILSCKARRLISLSKYAFTLFYLPLIIFLIYAAVRSIILERDRIKKSFLYWQFSGIIIVWLILITVAPQQYTYFQVFYTIFITGVVFQITAEFFEKPKIKRILYLCLFISYLPFFKTTLLIPLTWEKQDTYEYNKKLILAEVPAGSRVVTDTRFWYLFDKNYAVFDLRQLRSHITGPWDYVLLASGGSGKPDVPLINFTYPALDYLKQHFIKQLSTMSNQPNRLFGIPISKSRWCYRFELYRRK